MTDYYTQEENVSFHSLRFSVFFVLVPFLKQPFVPSSVDEGEIVAARYSDESSFYRWTSAQPEDFRLKNLKWVNN